MLHKIPKISIESFTMVDAMASVAHFPTPSWARKSAGGHEGDIKNTNNAFSKGLCVYQNTNSSASKLWMPGLQESIFQHLLEPEAGPEGGNRKYK